jgi:ketosteroid isomerase-like protein
MHGEAERVRIQNKRFYEALSSQNILSMEKVWSRSSYVRCVHPGWNMLEGWESIRDSWRTIFTNAICLTVEPETSEVNVHGPIAVVTCRERISSFTLDGSSVTTALATNIFEKREGRWLLIHHHASPMGQDRGSGDEE